MNNRSTRTGFLAKLATLPALFAGVLNTNESYRELKDALGLGDDVEMVVMDRRQPNEGTCQKCGARDEDLRPYGPGGIWICFDCGMADEDTTKKQFDRYLSEGADAIV